MSTISERLGLTNEIVEFKFGRSFTGRRPESARSKEPAEAYHTIRCRSPGHMGSRRTDLKQKFSS